MIRPLLMAVAMLLPLTGQAQTTPEPQEYRQDHYRGPVPTTLQGATVVDVQQAHALWQQGEVAFIDVLPRAPKPEGLPEGTIWREKPRNSIPGALWLPNVGYGRLAQVTDAYFRAGLARATSGNSDHPVLFFCLDECWMSWNAARRAVKEYGYSQVYWFPQGTDDWEFEDFPTEQVQPEPPG